MSPFASEDEVDSTATRTLETIYAISPTIDLVKEHCYNVQNQTTTHNPHTVFVSHDNFWTNEQRQAKCVMFAFGYAVGRKRFGDKLKQLPEPITVQCVNMDLTTLNLVFFQLNTLNFSDDGGIKNMVWVDSNNAMFEKHLPQPWLGPEYEKIRLDNYDPKAFQKPFI